MNIQNRTSFRTTPALTLLALSLSFALTGCGGSSGSSDNTAPAPAAPSTFTLAVSDAPVDSAVSVNVYFDEVELVGGEGGPVRFSVTDENGDPRVIDLLQLQGEASETIVAQTEIPPGSYTQIRLSVTDDSYIEMEGGTLPLRVPSGELKLDGFDVSEGVDAAYTVEFDLRKSLVDPVGQDLIMLKPRGVRLVSNDAVGTLQGTVSETLILAPECAVKNDPSQGNAVYLYEGANLDNALLGDDADAFEGDTEIRPFAVVPVTQDETDQSYSFTAGFLPAGDYTVSFTCLAEFDEPESDENEAEGFALQTQNEVIIASGQTTSLTIE